MIADAKAEACGARAVSAQILMRSFFGPTLTEFHSWYLES